jgi:chromosome segregation ATPase
MNRSIAHPTLVLGALVAALALPAAAQAPAKKRLGTRDELRACMNSEAEIQTRQKALKERADKMAEEAKALRAESEELAPERKRMEADDWATGPARQRLERKIKAHDARLKAAQESENAFDGDRQAFEKDLAGWREKCTTASFDPDDKEAVLKEREAAKK